ncbi:MAG: Flp family type IVb pilin [Alsobacter sp.]|jgi:pilus assembly protein Flp/PilA|nr:Flp family type IVb pilin [Burkholderiales bacterium]
MKHVLRRFVRDESGATAIEYGLIAAIIAVGLIASLQTLQGNLKDTFSAVGTAVKDAK